jgi:RNA polymerase sigma factor (sigma-70 family)
VTDAEAIARSLRRPAAFEAVFERHFAVLFRYLRRRVGADAAEDLVAETFTRAFAARASFDASYADARPWLFGIATNVLRAYLRSRTGMAPAAREPDEASDVEARLDAAAAVGALRALPPEQREVLLLVAVAESTYEETAQALGIQVGTVRSRMSRARARLQPLEEPR